MNNRICRVLLLAMLMATMAAKAQETFTYNTSIADRGEFSCDFHKTDFPPSQVGALEYVCATASQVADFLVQHECSYVSCSYDFTDFEDEDCSYSFTRVYHVFIDSDVGFVDFNVNEVFVVFKQDPDNVATPITEILESTYFGYYEEDLLPERNIRNLTAIFPEIHSSCGSDDLLELTVSLEEGEDNGCMKEYIRTYTVTDPCPEMVVATITEHIHLESKLKVWGDLDVKSYNDPNEPLPPAYTTIEQLRAANAHIHYSREESDLTITSEEVHTDIPNRRKRIYTISASSCPENNELVRTVTETFKREVKDLVPFSYFVTDVTMEGINDGRLEIYPPEKDEGCKDDPYNPNSWYSVILNNNTTGERIVAQDPDFSDIYTIENLAPGVYDLYIVTRCSGCDILFQPVYHKSFEIKTRKINVKITDGIGLYSDHSYVSYLAVVSVLGSNNEPVCFEEYDQIAGRFSDEWELATGKLYSPNKMEWDLYEMYNPYMGGNGVYERVLYNYETFNELGGNGLQRMIVAKDEGVSVTYRLYKKNNLGEVQSLFRCATYNVYDGELVESNDPNEIFGPAGYTNADSTVVRMVNATDDMNYTIQFENDPEFATSAAARVKITCPLDEHADPTTFRLGNFGFGEFTFEVPPLSSYYNNRINMDSLGYWLDVTASIQVPENEAYWIFQTIDPATGVAPIDSLGFLPVNDTLTGVGEGFVTFTVSPKAGNSRSQIYTGDTIVEQAQIYFDENEVVPTNRYKNTFDAVAPTSTIVCDTTGAAQTGMLNIGFSAADDPEGSGVRYVELYANVDLAGYERIAQIHPDSLFPYALTDGTNFEFMCLAVDNVDNKEPYKPYHELFYCLGNPPRDLELSNNVFEENDAVGTSIGSFTTYDDQNSDNFVYALVDGEGSGDNHLFRVEGNTLKTNYDFRCYGSYEYSIRVRTTDITNAYLEKTFTVLAHQTETIEPTLAYHYLCPGDSFYFNGHYITEPATYMDTLSSQMGCDSIVRMVVQMNPSPVTTEVADVMCYGDDYTDNGFNLSADSLAVLTQGWTMEDDIILYLDNYVENAFRCFDTTRLTLTLHPSYHEVDEVSVCAMDLPYVYHDRWFFADTTYVLRYATATGCDSTFTLQLTVNPSSTQTDNLAGGWNWYSTYIDQSNGQGLTELENALGTHGRTIKSKTQFVQYSPELNGWYGNLNEIDGLCMYQIETDDAHTMELSGCYGTPDSITLHSGWSWISYPLPSSMYVSQTPSAVSGYPTDGDIFKAKSSFAMYYADYGMWFGTLSVLDPGQGYMYNSNSDADKYLYYPNASRAEGHPVEIPQAHWANNIHHFADNITFLGVIELDGQTIESDTLEVGVFCNGEERGSGRALYLEEMNAFRIFLTVQGKDGDELSFRLFDHSRDKERRIRCRQQVVFHADDHYGDPKHPYHFCFATDYDKHIVAEICEGQYYVENGFRVYQPGTYFKELTGQYGNDSIIRLDLTVNPVYQYEEEVVAVEFPFHYGDKVFDKPGTYTLPFQTEHGCDSVLVVKVAPYEGLRELLVSPVPANRGERVTLYFPFTREEQQDLQVEVYTLAGGLMQYTKPTRYPIELEPITVSGTYMVKVTMGTGEVVTGKIIVR